jgi:hypothetical protein
MHVLNPISTASLAFYCRRALVHVLRECNMCSGTDRIRAFCNRTVCNDRNDFARNWVCRPSFKSSKKRHRISVEIDC